MSALAWQIGSYVSLGLCALLLLAMTRLCKRPGLALNQWPNLHMKYDLPFLQDCFAKGAAVALPYLLLSLALEVCLCPALAAVAHNTAALRPVRLAMYGLAALRSLLGVLEAACLLRLHRQMSPGLARLSSALASGKWGAFALWALGMFASLLVSGAKL